MIPLIGVMLTLVLFLVTGGMTIADLVMAARNRSSIEENFNGENPYSFPSCLDNIRQLFGPIDYRLLVPTTPVRRCDGEQLGKAEKCPSNCDGTEFPLGFVAKGSKDDTGERSATTVRSTRYGSADSGV
jgi:hypothetical protein